MESINLEQVNKAQKLLLIFQEIARPQGAFVDELKEKFELDDRTFRRYVKNLIDIEIPIKKEKTHDEFGKRSQKLTLAPEFQRSNVQVSLMEWISLRFGKNLFSFLEGTAFSSDLDQALDSISHIRAGKTAELTKNIDQKFLNIPESTKDHTRSSDTIDSILTCLLHQCEAEAFYSKINSPMKKYILHPYTLVTYRQGLYLFAYDVDAQIVKTFAVERFQSFKFVMKRKFQVKSGYSPADMIKDSFGIIKGANPVNITLQFNRRTAPYIQERTWHRSQELEAAPKGEIILRMRVGITHELKQWILGFGSQVRILTPQSLADDIREEHRRAAEQ